MEYALTTIMAGLMVIGALFFVQPAIEDAKCQFTGKCPETQCNDCIVVGKP